MIATLEDGTKVCTGQRAWDKQKIEQLLGGTKEIVWIEEGHCGDGQSIYDYCI